MGRTIKIIFIMFSLLFLASCNEDNTDLDKNNNIINETLELAETNIALNEGENYTFDVTVEIVVTSSNQGVVSVKGKTITAIKEGTAEVIVTLKSNEDIKRNINVVVLKKVSIFDSLEEEISLEKLDVYTLNVSGLIILTAKDESIVEVDSENKTIKALNSGETVVTIYDANDNSNYKSINVVVKDAIGELIIEYDSSIHKGEYGKIKVTSTYKNDEVTIESYSKSIIEIDNSAVNDMIAKAINVGYATIRVSNLYGEIKVLYIEVLKERNPNPITAISFEIVEEGPYYLEETYHLNVQIMPVDATGKIKFAYKSTFIDLDSDTFEFVVKGVGDISIECYSKDNPDISATINFASEFNPSIETYDLLFIGNSLTSFKHSIPAYVSNMIRETGAIVKISADSYSPQWIIDHKTGFTTLIKQKKYTHVILQERSIGPITDYNKFESAVLEFNKLIEENGAQLVLYQTWAYNLDYYLGLTKKEFTDRLVESYDKVGKMTNAIICRVGEAFELYESLYQDLPSLYYDDHHPSIYGSYLSACVHYATLTGRRASENGYKNSNIEEDVMKEIQKVADLIVFD